jgi:hypothetical protein
MVGRQCDEVGQEVRIKFSRHAVERYLLRGRPGLDYETARAELEQMWLTGEITCDPPSWLADARHDADSYLMLADVSFPLRAGVSDPTCLTAMTCLGRGAIKPCERRNRHRRRGPRWRAPLYRLAAANRSDIGPVPCGRIGTERAW